MFAENQLKIKYFQEIYKGLDKLYHISTHMQNDKCKHLLGKDNTFFVILSMRIGFQEALEAR